MRKVIGAAIVASVHRMSPSDLWTRYSNDGAVDRELFDRYFEGVTEGCAIRLEGIVKLANAVDAAQVEGLDFATPQSYRFVTDNVTSVLRNRLLETPA